MFWSKKSAATLTCSFCNKTQQEVRKLVAGPNVHICDECIGLSNDIINEEQKVEIAGRRAQPAPDVASIERHLDGLVIGHPSASAPWGARVAAVTTRGGEFVEEPRCPAVHDTEAVAARLLAERAEGQRAAGGHQAEQPDHLDGTSSPRRRAKRTSRRRCSRGTRSRSPVSSASSRPSSRA